MLIVLLIALMVWAIYRLVPDNALPVKQVTVTGQFRHLDVGDIQQRAMPYMDRDFFSVNLALIEKAIGNMPWVYEVSVRRVWPETIEIHIIEQEAVAQWGEQALLNPYGEIFEPATEQRPAGLPMIHGPESRRHDLIKSFLDIHSQLKSIGLLLNSLIEDRRGSWVVGLNNGLKLSLGQREQRSRLRHFIQAYPGLIAARKDQVKSIDLRYSNGLAIAWEQQPDGANALKKGD
jgi:cell division protein FtsQ